MNELVNYDGLGQNRKNSNSINSKLAMKHFLFSCVWVQNGLSSKQKVTAQIVLYILCKRSKSLLSPMTEKATGIHQQSHSRPESPLNYVIAEHTKLLRFISSVHLWQGRTTFSLRAKFTLYSLAQSWSLLSKGTDGSLD